jgi:hypothetical protein
MSREFSLCYSLKEIRESLGGGGGNENKNKAYGNPLCEDCREALLLGHCLVCSSVVLKWLDVVLDHLPAAIGALFLKYQQSAICNTQAGRWDR